VNIGRIIVRAFRRLAIRQGVDFLPSDVWSARCSVPPSRLPDLQKHPAATQGADQVAWDSRSPKPAMVRGRRRRYVASAASVAAIGALALPGVAGAQTITNHQVTAASSGVTASGVGSLTVANVGVVNNQSQTGVSYTDVPVTVNTGCANTPLFLCLNMTGVGGFTTVVSSPLEAGQVLDNPNLTVTVKGQSCGYLAQTGGYQATMEVDQVNISGGSVNAVAIQYSCSNSAITIIGTIAYNMTNSTAGQGYYIYDTYGDLFNFGNNGYLAYLSGPTWFPLAKPIEGMDTTPDGGGYWMVASDGGIFASGDAPFLGSTGGVRLAKPVVGMASTPDGKGYWLVASDGGIFAFGDAHFYGSTGGIKLNKPVVGMASTPDGKGYWLVASDGGIFAFGDAHFYGSTGNIRLNKPVNGMTVTPDGKGYWFVASDGGIFAYGDARFYGSTGGVRLDKPVVGMESTSDGRGYWLVASDGGLFNYGDATFHGSLGGQGFNNVVGMRR
jgi:hypothetical protein